MIRKQKIVKEQEEEKENEERRKEKRVKQSPESLFYGPGNRKVPK